MGMRDEQRIQRARAYREANRDQINALADAIEALVKGSAKLPENSVLETLVKEGADDPAVFLAEAVAIPAYGSTRAPLPADEGVEGS